MPPSAIQTTANSDVGPLLERIVGGLAIDQAADEATERREREQRFRRWLDFIGERGNRYADCQLATFDCSMPRQTTAVKKLTEYVRCIQQRVRACEGVVLYGSRGTGKDHLAVAVCREAIRNDITVKWCNGIDLFARVRASMDKSARETEKQIIDELTRPDVLYLSDPIPPTGNLTDFQQQTLFRVLDARYSRLKPAIVTVNVAKGSELDERIGAQNADRIKDGALAIHCDWPSHRRAQ